MTHGPAVQSGPDSNPVPGAGITPVTDEATGSDSIPALGSVYFYLTEGCNLACRHCWLGPQFDQDGKKRASLPLDLFTSVVSQGKALGMDRLKLTGGEPLLHPAIADILKVVREEALELTLETNGLLCTKELAEEIAACNGPHVSVSLDGADARTHEWVRGVESSFRAALQGVRNLAAAGVRPQVIMSLMRRNKKQVERVVRLAEDLGASSVKFNIVQPTARGRKLHQTGEALSIGELVELGAWVENELSRRTLMPLVFSHPAAFRPLSKMIGRHECTGVCGVTGIIGVLADGSYALCGIGKSVPELVFGHVEKDRLEDIWRNDPTLKEIREGMPHRLQGVCGRCLMKELCHGSCLAQNYYATKNLWSGFWYCEEARAMGLFPASRATPQSA